MARVGLLLLVVGLAAGCGGGSSSSPVHSQNTQSKSAPPGAGAAGSGMPTAPSEPYQMDPANHRLPGGPVAGRLDGKEFTPDRVEFTEKSLVFRRGKDIFPDQEVRVALRAEAGKPLLPAKVTVNPSQQGTDGTNPTISTSSRSGDASPRNALMTNGYALTLEIGPREKGKVRGTIYLCLPDEARSYLAGAFEAEWVRDFTAPPDAEDAPYIQGTVALTGKKELMVTVGYAGLTGSGETISDRAGVPIGVGAAVQSATYKPRLATLREDDAGVRYDFTRLPPGWYVVFAQLQDGPLAWQKVEVKSDGRHTLDLKLDAAAAGTVEVTVPADHKGALRLAPHDFGFPDPNDLLSTNLGFALDLQAEPKDGKARFKNVPPGKYAILPASGTIIRLGTVEVTAGKTATVELAPAKK